MSDASLALQGAIVTLLKANSTLTGLISQRVYDEVPADPTFPYVTVGDDQVVPDTAQDYDGADVITTIHGWSRAVGYPEVKRIGRAVNDAMLGASLSPTGFRVIEIVKEQIQYLKDPDGKTRHGVFVFRARTEPSA